MYSALCTFCGVMQVRITSSPTGISGLSMILSAFTGHDGVSGVVGPAGVAGMLASTFVMM